MLESLEKVAKEFLEQSKDKPIRVISHHDTDGITSATIMIQTLKKLDKDKLKNSLSHIKAVMRQDSSTHIESIQKILNDCGILYTVKKHVKNAPIKGLTVKTKKDQVMIAMTIRGKYVDIFWFTLFHEIAHVIYDDYLINQDDLLLNPTIEKRADKFAADTLIDPIMFEEFLNQNDFSEAAIYQFASKIHVLPTIVIGRLMHDSNTWTQYSHLRLKYDWA